MALGWLSLAAMDPTLRAIVWGGATLAVVIICVLVLSYLRRRARRRIELEPQGFTVEQLDRLKAAGQIGPEEYSRLRRAVLGLRMGGKENSPLSRPPKLDDESQGPKGPGVV